MRAVLLLPLALPAWPANRLAGEDSPYLRAHAENPVDWWPWGEEAFARARAEDKPVFLSIGYSSCYWCRVAEETLYRKPEIAALMNRWFINVKLDREQRPDLDRLYMAATRQLGGAVGWPNNLLLTPDRKPFFAGGYFPPEDDDIGREGFPRVLARLHDRWTHDRDGVLAQAEAVAAALRNRDHSPAEAVDPSRWRRDALRTLRGRADPNHGGLRQPGSEASFPQTPALTLLAAQPDPQVRRIVRHALDAMARGALRDHLGGGFHRYTVDRRWNQPHFEKMLYDNAQLLRLYAGAARGPLHRQAARATAEFLLRDLQDAGGGFHAALDAVSGGREGAHYQWSETELRAVLGEAAAARFLNAYRVVPLAGHLGDPADDLANDTWDLEAPRGALRLREDLSARALAARAAALAGEQEALLHHRRQRPAPTRDGKLILAWNGLAIEALAEAGGRLDDPRLTTAARRAAGRLWRDAWEAGAGRLRHAVFEGRPQGEGFLEDYALFGLGLLALETATGEDVWRERAVVLSDAMLARLARADGSLAETVHEAELFAPMAVGGDGPYAAGASAAWRLLDRLAPGAARFRGAADRLLAALAPQVARAPEQWPALLAALPRAASASERPRTAPAAAPAGPGAASATAPPLSAVAPSGSADVVAALARWVPLARGQRLVVSLRIAPGWHLHANPAGDGDLIPTRIEFRGARPGALRYPRGAPFRVAFATVEIPVYGGKVEIEADFPDGRPASAWLTVQACSDKVCLAPARVDLHLP